MIEPKHILLWKRPTRTGTLENLISMHDSIDHLVSKHRGLRIVVLVSMNLAESGIPGIDVR